MLTYKKTDDSDWTPGQWILFEFAKAAAAAVAAETIRIVYERYRAARESNDE
jgi:hypothetical protein